MTRKYLTSMKIRMPNMIPAQPQAANFCDFGVESADSVSPFVEALFDRRPSVRSSCSFSSASLFPLPKSTTSGLEKEERTDAV